MSCNVPDTVQEVQQLIYFVFSLCLKGEAQNKPHTHLKMELK